MARIIHGDCRDILPTLDAASVHCVVTSPPYWGLRDYGTASWDGGDVECDHRMPGANKVFGNPAFNENRPSREATQTAGYRDTCGKCGARRIDRQLGLEPTPEEYVAAMVAVFREVRRVLRDDGTVWLNLGDSYNTTPPGNKPNTTALSSGLPNSIANQEMRRSAQALVDKTKMTGLKPKDLVGIPWRVAFALQADGWYLRSDIIWSKPNPMPESVTDRPTKSHEYVFLLSKRERYYFDQEAVREAQVSDHPSGNGFKREARLSYRDENGARGNDEQWQPSAAGRNIRSVWNIATQPYPGAHFAVFPEALVVPCIKAGTSERGVCPECGSPWERVTQKVGDAEHLDRWGRPVERRTQDYWKRNGDNRVRVNTSAGVPVALGSSVYETTGWRPSCAHDAEPVPATVMDPFAGSGTVGKVAEKLSRQAILIELNGEYVGQVERRNAQVGLGLTG